MRVVLRARVAAAMEPLAGLAKRLREVTRDLAVQRALLGQGVSRLQPRPPRGHHAGAALQVGPTPVLGESQG